MKKRKMGALQVVILVILVIVFIFSSSLVIKHFIDIKNNRDYYEQIQNLVPDETEKVQQKPDYSSVVKVNTDTVGWVKVPNTNIDYPVVQFSNNDYYLNHDFDKKYNYRGAIFMDYRNNPTDFDANTIIYGHNCYDKTMFSELDQYEKIDFYKKTPVFEYNSLEKNYKWKIYAVFITNADASEDNGYVFNYIYPYMDGENFNGFIDEVNKRRLYVTGVDINDDDKMLVLSTCVRTLDTVNKYGKTTYRADARLVVLARAVRPGESEEVDVSKAYVNKNPKYPQLWYDNKNIENPFKNDKKWYPQEVVTNE